MNLSFASDEAAFRYLIDQWQEEATMENEPTISTEEAKSIVSTKMAPRVTEESIKARIGGVTYHHIDQLTICVITMVNGFHVTGVSAPASAANYDEKVGERYAFDNAFKSLWQLEGYLLRDRLHRETQTEQAKDTEAKQAERAADAREG